MKFEEQTYLITGISDETGGWEYECLPEGETLLVGDIFPGRSLTHKALTEIYSIAYGKEMYTRRQRLYRGKYANRQEETNG